MQGRIAFACDVQVMAEAEALKAIGNQLFKDHKFAAAAQAYSEAIEVEPMPVLYSNRAQAYIKSERWCSKSSVVDRKIGCSDNVCVSVDGRVG